MKKLVIVLSAVFAAFVGCGKNEPAEAVPERSVSSRDQVVAALSEIGVHEGYDYDRGREVEVGTHAFSLKDEQPEGDCKYEFTYDFADDAGDDFETKRFKAMWKAYADGLAKIARSGVYEASESTSHTQTDTSIKSSLELAGVKYLTMAETMTADGEYEVSVAVVQSKKTEAIYSRSPSGGESKPGKYTLADWLELISDNGMICPQSYCDNEGVWWRVAGVPVALDAGRNSKKVAVLTEKAKRYAYEAAMRTIAVGVSVSSSITSYLKDVGGAAKHLQKLSQTVRIKPMDTVLPVDSSQIQFLELNKKDPITGKPVRCVVAALRSGNCRSVTKPAEDQAYEYMRESGLEFGFDAARKIVTQMVVDTFEYEKTMSDEEFARKRYRSVQRALMMGAVDISRQIEQVADVSDRERRSHGFGRDWMFTLGHFADDEDDESWIPQLIRQMTDREFSWRIGLVGSRGTAEMKFPVYGLSVVRQFESLSDDVYQVALILSLDIKKGRDEIISFGEEKPERPGEMSLRQWMDAQDLGLVAGPRRFVDNEGTIWALGIVPAADGQQPYGTLLDAAARECAALAFGGDLAVSINGEDALRSITGSGDKSADAENPKNGSFIEFKGVVWYPRELEQYFHRTYTHPLTGRKGVVSICALRSGASKIMKDIYAKKIQKNYEKQYEAGMRAGMRETLKGVEKELDGVKADDNETKRRISELRHEISRLEDALQDERSVRPKNRKRTQERLAETARKVAELKGGKSNEGQQ